MKLPLITLTGEKSTVTVSDTLFGGKLNLNLIAQAVHVYRSNQRQGGAQAKTRGDVELTTKKVYKQKGTGGARHGARSAPIFVGGGAAHGPTGLENWKRTMPVQMKRQALVAALSLSANDKKVSILSDLETISGKAKDGKAFAQTVRAADNAKILIVADTSHENVLRSFRNLDRVAVSRADRLTVWDVVNADQVLVMKPSLKVLEDRLAKVGKENA